MDVVEAEEAPRGPVVLIRLSDLPVHPTGCCFVVGRMCFLCLQVGQLALFLLCQVFSTQNWYDEKLESGGTSW